MDNLVGNVVTCGVNALAVYLDPCLTPNSLKLLNKKACKLRIVHDQNIFIVIVICVAGKVIRTKNNRFAI